jgi:hypothetical protein
MKTYMAGKQILTLSDFDRTFKNETLLFVKCWGRTSHPIIIANMQYRTVKSFLERGQLFKAKKI